MKLSMIWRTFVLYIQEVISITTFTTFRPTTPFTTSKGPVSLIHVRIPANMRRSRNVGTMLGQRRRRWPSIVPTLCERFMFADMTPMCLIIILEQGGGGSEGSG